MSVPRIGALATLAVIVVVGIPIFIRMPVWVDIYHHDLCARNVLEAGVHYRDTFETSPPGILWIHLAVRSLLGWSSEAIRFADLLFVGAIIGLLIRWLRLSGQSTATLLWTVVALCAFYFPLSEHCHCQRDTWMLLPALLALSLRLRQQPRLLRATPVWSLLWPAVLEGSCWGAAFWIKPFIIVPALLCWLLGVSLTAFGRTRSWAAIAVDWIGLLAGGLAIGGVGLLWLWDSGALPHWYRVVVDWLPEYKSAVRLPTGYSTLAFMEFVPWSAAHLVALPVAAVAIGRALRDGSRTAPSQAPSLLAPALTGCFYLGWLVQATLLQHGFAYHHVPPLLLAIAVAASWRGIRSQSFVGRVNLIVFVAVALVMNPLLRWHRLAAWPRCWSEWSSPVLRDQLKLQDAVDWQDLERVAQYLRSQDLHDRELTCYAASTIPLYQELGIKPSTPFVEFSMFLKFFPQHRQEILVAQSNSPSRFVVTDGGDWWSARLSREEAIAQSPGDPLALPSTLPDEMRRTYPWAQPVVFRAGRYFVHADSWRSENP
jgi:hypothetical protein